MTRTAVIERAARRSERFVYWLARHWLAVFMIAWGVFVILPWLAPVLMKLGATGPADAIYFVYQFFCHQLPERSFFLFGPQPMYSVEQIGAVWPTSDPNVLRQFAGNADFGWKVAYSDRMVAMYTAFWIASIGFAFVRRRLKPLPLWAYFLLVLPMAIDGTTHLLSDPWAFNLDFRTTNEWLGQVSGGGLPAPLYAPDRRGGLLCGV